MQAGASPVLEVRDLELVQGNFTLRLPTLSLAPGERLGLLGANGSGKTTLLEAIAGHPPARAYRRGEVRVRSADAAVDMRTNAPAGWRQLAYCLQNPDEVLFCESIREDLAFAPRNYLLSAKQIGENTTRLTATLGLGALLERPASELSFGEKKRAAIASVLSHDPALVLLDEPFSGLDPRQRRELSGFLSGLAQALLLSAHEASTLRGCCNRWLVLKEGACVFLGSTQELDSNAEFHQQWGIT